MEHTSIFKIFSFLILLSLLALPVSAVTITFSELNVDWGTNQEIMVYDGMGQLVQIANTSASIVLDDNMSSYLFVFRPTQDVWFQDPMNAFELIKLNFGPLVSFVLFIAVVLGLLAVVLGIFWRR